MDRAEFRAMLDLFMASDPTPLTKEQDESLRMWLDKESRARGFNSWVDAFHLWKGE